MTTVAKPGGVLIIRGGPEVNNVRFTSIVFSGPGVIDPGGIVAGEGCRQVSATEADCGSQWALDAALGDGDDALNGAFATLQPTVVHGEGGNDTIFGNSANDKFYGGPGNDTLSSGGGDDILDGGPGDDTLNGGGNNDTITGGPGRDNVSGDATIAAEDGNDTIDIRDGEPDSASCGLGADRVLADRADVIDSQDCESVDTTGSPTTTGSAGPVRVALNAPISTEIARFLRRGLRVRATFQGAATATARLTVSGNNARKLKRRGTVELTRYRFTVKDGEYVITLFPKARYRRALRRVSSFLAIRVVVTARGASSSGSARDSGRVIAFG